MNKKAVGVLAMTLAFAQMALAGPFSVYPGATRMPEPKGNPNHAVFYSTPDAYAKVLEYYEKDGKVNHDHEMPGATIIEFDGGGGIIVRDMGERGTVIVVNHRTK